VRGFVLAGVLALAAATTTADPKPTPAATARPDIKMPPGTRTDATGQLVSGRGIRDTTDFIAKQLDRRGILVNQIGPSRLRGVELTRFISTTASTTWLAIHVLRTGGKTLIFFVPRPQA